MAAMVLLDHAMNWPPFRKQSAGKLIEGKLLM
jgi:hypothetical protein